ncbi:DUF1993 domain-containing protein [Labrys sp. KNU-23]|uniref:DUF1993 family protein n=1 Tax=Labrys sp. KNU-23 TaxID=2789216 RepID=UPI0011F04974|nr:DUF1993 domain-containing protein [Labrys sp. KNU-23]QEN87504.1 DUF1993 domain-containing protein [Labrys sp. KNU-23]
MADLFDVSVPVFLRYLSNLDTILGKTAEHLQLQGTEETEVLNLALQPNMFPLKWQVRIALGFSIRAINPVLQQPIMLDDGPIESIEDIRLLLGNTIARLRNVSRRDFAGGEARLVREKAGQAVFEAKAVEFVTQYALPNFFFHLGMAYSLLRLAGCPIGKGDFDGFHQYEAGVNLVREVQPEPRPLIQRLPG